jgi:hypothetical protein
LSDRLDIPPASATNFSQRVRETLMTYLGRQGNSLDRGLTLRDLVENAIDTRALRADLDAVIDPDGCVVTVEVCVLGRMEYPDAEACTDHDPEGD